MRPNFHKKQIFYISIVLGIFVWACFFGFTLLQPHQVMAAADSQVAPASPEELVPVGDEQKPQKAPAQKWQYKQGLLTAQGGLSSGGASGSLAITNQAADWLWDLRLDSGLLNGEFGVNMSAAGGWSPTGAYGAWLKLSGEFSSEAWEHFQALLNLGWRPVEKLSLLVTLAINRLVKIALSIEQTDGNKGHIQVAGGLAMVTGEDTQATRVNRKAFMETEFGTEIGNQVLVRIQVALYPGATVFLQVGVKARQHPVVVLHKDAVFRCQFEFVLGNAA